MEEFLEKHPILGAVVVFGVFGIWYMVLWLI